jgi:two-component system NarL family sensor kinase
MSPRLVATLSLALIVLTGVLLVGRISTPSDGSVVQLSNTPWRGDRMILDFVLDRTSDLREGDVVVAVDGQPIAFSLERGGVAQEPLRTGQRFTYTVVRDGRRLDVAVQLQAFSLNALLARSWSALLLLASVLAIAIFVFGSRPTDPAAQDLLLVAALMTCGTTAWLLGDQVLSLATHGPSLADLAGELALALLWGSVVHFTLVAPGAHRLLPSRAAYVVAYALPLGLHAAYLAVSLPTATSRLEAAGRLVQVSLVPSSVLPAGVAILMAVIYATTTDQASRRRLRWVLATLALGAAAWLGLWTVPAMLGLPSPAPNLVPLVFLPCPLALGAAILRYRLFDIEVILRRSLLYGSLTVCVLAIYLGTTWLLSLAIGPQPGLIALFSSGLVALCVLPLGRYLRRRVGRLVYGERDDPYEVISQLGRVDAAAAPRAILNQVVVTLAQSLRLPYVAIELRRPRGGFSIEASYGQPRGTPSALPLTHAGTLVGRLLLAVGPGREPFGPADQRLLDALTNQVGGAAHTVLLTAELQRSREQLVLAREEERRRMHHRLHDGLGPGLAAGTMQMEAAKHLLRRDADAAEALLDELIGNTRELIADVRGLVYNLRPPALDQLGLVGAIRERAGHLAQPAGQTTTRLRVVVSEQGRLDSLPAAVEVAAFWITVEAVSNAVRHATATVCEVRLARDETLRLEVCDDGRGLPDGVTPGGGLVSMRERAEELGGTCAVERNIDGGTVVRVRLPIPRLEVGP